MGCRLPLQVIPYDDQLFDLPDNAFWLEDDEVFCFLKEYNAHRMMRKYVCLMRQNYCFVDTDVVFLKDPSEALLGHDGFVANCTHWNNPNHTLTRESEVYFRSKSTTYPKFLFNAGQFACDRPIYHDFNEFKASCLSLPDTTLSFPFHDQPGLNYLVSRSEVPFTNLTLPPHNIESSWAGDYIELGVPPSIGSANAPYLLHWAGLDIDGRKPIDQLFLQHMPEIQRRAFLESQTSAPTSFVRRLKNFSNAVIADFKSNFWS